MAMSPYQETVSDLIDSRNLTNLTSKTPYSKTTYFQQYQESFKDGEYHFSEPVSTIMGRVVRTYMSGGIGIGPELPAVGGAGSPGQLREVFLGKPS